MGRCQPCTMDYSKGYGTGVADALGNWGFSSGVASPGHELKRMVCLLERMEELKEPPKCSSQKKKSSKKTCTFIHHTPDARPAWTRPNKSPMITFTSCDTILKSSSKRIVADSIRYPIPERCVRYQGDDKWYKLGPLCCPQPSCPAPCCKPEKVYYCRNICW